MGATWSRIIAATLSSRAARIAHDGRLRAGLRVDRRDLHIPSDGDHLDDHAVFVRPHDASFPPRRLDISGRYERNANRPGAPAAAAAVRAIFPAVSPPQRTL
jgi:hypothetical protein